MFRNPNQKGMQILMHFLLNLLDPQKAEKVFKSCWPCYDANQSRLFRSSCYQWLSNLEKSGELNCTVTESQLRTCHGDR